MMSICWLQGLKPRAKPRAEPRGEWHEDKDCWDGSSSRGDKRIQPRIDPWSSKIMRGTSMAIGFVPEGQHDSSQARSAWNHEENGPV